MELLLGCGNKRVKIMSPLGANDWTRLVTLDIDPNCKPDVLADIELGLPFADNTFKEIHAYDVLEHFGRQGDYRAFFKHFADIYRVLTPYGFLCGITPRYNGRWAWNDPGHTRIISPFNLQYLNQATYDDQVGKTPMTDYRWLWKGDLRLVYSKNEGESHTWILQAYKDN